MGLLNWLGLGRALSSKAMASMPEDDGSYQSHLTRDEAMKRRKAHKKAKAAKAARRRNRRK